MRSWAKELANDPINFGKNPRTLKSGKKPKCPALEGELVKYIMAARAKKLAITCQMLIDKAKVYCETNGIVDMKLSPGWLRQFFKRNKIVKRRAMKIVQKDPAMLIISITQFKTLINELR